MKLAFCVTVFLVALVTVNAKSLSKRAAERFNSLSEVFAPVPEEAPRLEPEESESIESDEPSEDDTGAVSNFVSQGNLYNIVQVQVNGASEGLSRWFDFFKKMGSQPESEAPKSGSEVEQEVHPVRTFVQDNMNKMKAAKGKIDDMKRTIQGHMEKIKASK